MENTSNVKAEANAILQEDIREDQQHTGKVIIQNDSLLMQKVLIREQNYPWHVKEYVQPIWKLIYSQQVQYKNILREGNQLADHLANVAIDRGDFAISSFQQLQVIGR